MSFMYDCLYIDADKQIDIIKDYLDSLDECDLDKIGDLEKNLKWFIENYIKEQTSEKENEKLKEIKDIAQGMHDWWINKTPYTDVNELAEHLLGTELNRILWVLEDTDER